LDRLSLRAGQTVGLELAQEKEETHSGSLKKEFIRKPSIPRNFTSNDLDCGVSDYAITPVPGLEQSLLWFSVRPASPTAYNTLHHGYQTDHLNPSNIIFTFPHSKSAELEHMAGVVSPAKGAKKGMWHSEILFVVDHNGLC